MESNYSNKDDMLSTLTKSRQQQKSLLGKRPAKVTSDKILKEAKDALVYKTSQSALLGGDNPELNFEKNKAQKVDDDGFKAPLPVGKQSKLTMQNLNQLPQSDNLIRDPMGINSSRFGSERQSSIAGGSNNNRIIK